MTLRRSPMNRGTSQLLRNGLSGKAPAAPKPVLVKKPAAEPKPAPGPRKTRCKVCKSDFLPPAPWIKHCSTDCGAELGQILLAKQKAKAQRQERAQDKIKREGMKTYPQLIRDVQKAFNQVVRLRDQIAGWPCISSGRPLDWSGNATDCGHYRSTGSAPHLRFNFDNAHAQSKHDNQYKAGAAVDYRIGLIARIGLERVEALESDNKPRKWTHDELRSMKEDFQRQVRELKEQKA